MPIVRTRDAGHRRRLISSCTTVISGSENVYPRAVEEFLYSHRKVQDVQVVGVPDPSYGKELCALICLRARQTASPEEIRNFCRGQIAHYKIPRHIRFFGSYPMTITGKVHKFLMRQESIAELGLAEQKKSELANSRL